MSDQRLKIAVFIDFDNVEIGVKTTLGLPFDIGAVLEAIKERGEIITKVAYGDWKRSGDYGRAMAQHAVRLVQRVPTPGGDKNGADINLALDALEMAFTHPHINAFVIVGGDSDFISLLEKLKQYDKKVFVVGGRQFTSNIMQKNCHEFIAYENLLTSSRRQQGGRPQKSGERQPSLDRQPVEQAVPLVKRALKVLSEREVSPQLGLLKSTLLQLDSTFSERTYGVGTFRDFVEKLEKLGLVSVKQEGRNLLVELKEGYEEREVPDVPQVPQVPSGPSVPREGSPRPEQAAAAAADPEKNAEGVSELKRILIAAKATMRWPLYIRQMKQVLKTNAPGFDERTYGFPGPVELLRAAQKDGLVRMERDRQGAVRLFQGAALQAAIGTEPASGHAAGQPGNEEDMRGNKAPVSSSVPLDDEPITVDVVDTTAQALGLHASGRGRRGGARKRSTTPMLPSLEADGNAGGDDGESGAQDAQESDAAQARAAKKPARAAKPKAEKVTKAAKAEKPKVERRKTPRKPKA
ncbi:MAG: NYN domain-containing protein [Acidobacteriota bacterium]|nr:NYN domain-containing protein [Acidobacteriota bacterium]